LARATLILRIPISPSNGKSSVLPTDELRQSFVDATVAQAEILGLTIPDPNLKWNEARGHYDFSEINWDEFWQVVKGNGPCNKERLAARIKAKEDGAWVRRSRYRFC